MRRDDACAVRTAEVFFLEDDRAVVRAIARLVATNATLRMTVAESCAQARAELPRAGEWSGAIIDVRLPDGDGLDVLEELLGRAPLLPSMVLTGAFQPDVAARAKLLGARFVVKPPVEAEIADFIQHVAGCRSGFSSSLRRAAASMADRNGLTRRHAQILFAIALDDRRDAAALDQGIRPSTLRTYLKVMLQRTGADDVRHLGAMVRAEALAAEGREPAGGRDATPSTDLALAT